MDNAKTGCVCGGGAAGEAALSAAKSMMHTNQSIRYGAPRGTASIARVRRRGTLRFRPAHDTSVRSSADANAGTQALVERAKTVTDALGTYGVDLCAPRERKALLFCCNQLSVCLLHNSADLVCE
jgi:hypothetical protein